MDSFGRILGFSAALLVFVLIGATFLPPPWSWAVGFVYIAYDTWLLSHMVLSSRRAIFRREPLRAVVPVRLAVIVAARNEANILPKCIDAVLAQTEPPDRLLIVDDGSTDGTLDLLQTRYGVVFDGENGRSKAHPILNVLRKVHTGKARSLNDALAKLDEDVVVTLDADTIPEVEAMEAVRREFETHPHLSAACGVLRPVAHGGRFAGAFELYQRFEYLRAFLWRLAWMDRGTLILLSGAFAAFRREALVAVSGFDADSLVEDYELMFRLHRRAADDGKPLEVRVIGGARAVTDSPGEAGQFLRQRSRWFAGFLQTMFRYRDMVGSNRYGRLGNFHLRVKTVDMLLPVYGLAAVVVLVWILASGASINPVVVAAIVAKLLFDLACHFYSMALFQRWQGDRMDLKTSALALLATLTEPLGFQLLRQFGAMLGWMAFLRGRLVWHPSRTFDEPPSQVRTRSSNNDRTTDDPRTRSSA